MRISKNKWIDFIVMAALMMLLAGIPATLMAGGEPGAGCDPPQGEDYKYDPAPFMGDLTVEWDEKAILVTGEVVQAGNMGCSINLVAHQITGGVEYDEFINLKSNYLRGQCIESIPNESFDINCDTYEFNIDALFETVACGGLKWADDEHSFEAKFVIMKLQ